MLRRLPGRAVAALLALVSTAGVAAADHAHDTTADPALRRLVRGLGDGTALGPAMDALAAVGSDAVWSEAAVVVVGATVVLTMAFGPALAMVAVHWTHRRLRWLFWSTVDGVRRGVLVAVAGLRAALDRPRTSDDPSAGDASGTIGEATGTATEAVDGSEEGVPAD